MKKKILTITLVLFVISLIVAVVFFFLMKGEQPDEDMPVGTDETDVQEYNVSHIVEKIKFLKLNTYDEIKEYADEYPIYIQTSDDDTLFAIGELYIEDSPVTLFYSLNEDGSLKRFDGTYSYTLDKSNKECVHDAIFAFNRVLTEHFMFGMFNHDMIDNDGVYIDVEDIGSYELMLDGKAEYSISVIDEHNTYWYITASVTDKKKIDFEFFRSFDASAYGEDYPNIDLRITEETGE